MNEVYATYKERGLEIVGITDENRSTVRKFLKDVPIEYHVARDSKSKLAKEFGVRGIPHAVLADRQGKIVWEGHPMALPKAQIDKILE